MTGPVTLARAMRRVASRRAHRVRQRGPWRTIGGRLAFGFGVVVCLLGLVTLRAYVAVRAADRESRRVVALSRDEYDLAQRVVSLTTGALAAGMQYANSGAPEARARYEALGLAFDSLRVGALRLRHLSSEQRARLEDVGRVQRALEVRIGVARVNQALGRRDAALAALDAAAGDLASLDAALAEFRAGTADRVAAAQGAVSAETRRSEASVGALSALAFALAVAFSVSTARAVARPLEALAAHARALRRGDFAARTASRRMPGELALLGAAINRAAASLAALRAALTHQAEHDPLTGLANRARFRAAAARALAAATPAAPGSVAVLALDLDGFKAVNDSLGHAAGDQLLMGVAARLLDATRGSDTVARLGGDEFAVLLGGVRDDAEAVVVAERILNALRAPFVLDGTPVVVGTSVGIARGPGAAAGADADADNAGGPPADAAAGGRVDAVGALLRDADLAMYRAKAAGKRRYAVFEPAMHAAVRERLVLEADLRGALARGEFRVFYQPIVDLATGRTAGVEALARWQHPRRGLMQPAEFIPLAEETGLVVPLGRWVLEEACRQGAAWQRLQAFQGGGAPLTVSVNLSGRQLQHPALVDDVAAALAASGLARGSLVLELTEGTVVEDPDAALERLTALKALGVRLAIDDFGTGYSALSYLQRFPIDVLKLDKAFVDGVTRGGAQAALARTIVALGDALALRTVAEGIEGPDQRACLAAMGCALGQGYHFARPLPPEALTALLADPAYAELAAAG